MDFTALLDEHHVPYHTTGPKCRDGWVNFACIYCGKDPYMGYSLTGRYVSCWQCGYHQLWEVIHLLTNLPARHCFELVGQLPKQFLRHEEKPLGKYVPPCGEGRLALPHKEYLRRRGLIPYEITSLWHVGGIGPVGRYKWRLTIPVHHRGELVSWTTRSLTDTEPRYLSAPDDSSVIPIRNCVYGIDHVRNACVIVEGPIDVWAIGPGAVAVLGLNLTPAKMDQLSRVPIRYICFDNEPDAQVRARNLARDMALFVGTTTNIVLETGKDPASAKREEIEELRRELFR